ncbi:MAG: diguanylate cyclase [Armatimonadetes bacterium]|nr:diguanylate cyclase [Armatimonadota bacterium]
MILLLTALAPCHAQTPPEFNVPNAPSLGQYTTEFLPVTARAEIERVYALLVDFRFEQALNELNLLAARQDLSASALSDVWTLIGYVHYNQRRGPDTVKALDKAIELEPKNATAHFFLASEYYVDGRKDLAEEHLIRAVRLRPTFVSAHRMLAELAKDGGQTGYAAEKYQEIVRLLPKSGYYNYQLYNAYKADGQFEKAIRTLDELIALEPGFTTNYYRKGEAYTKWYEKERRRELALEATRCYDQFKKLEPTNYQSALGPAKLAYDMGDMDTAQEQCNVANGLSPGHPDVVGLQAQLNNYYNEKRLRWIRQGATAGGLTLLTVLLAWSIRVAQRRAKVLSILSRFNTEAEPLYEFDKFKDFCLDFLEDELGLQRAALLLYSSSDNSLYEHGTLPEEVERIQLVTGKEVANWQLRVGNTLLMVRDLKSDAMFGKAFPSLLERFEARGFRAMVFLREGSLLRGLLALGWEGGRRVARRHLDILEPLSQLVAQNTERLHLYESTLHDEMTGLANRRCFEQRLSTEFRRASRYQQACSLVIFDIDNFKTVNDTYGHAQGDRVLVELAELVRRSLREGIDTASRTGGEEFSLILPATPLNLAVQTAERIRHKCERHRFSGFPRPHPITLSMGVATYPDHAPDEAELVKTADEAQYRAKKSGKNRVCPAGEVVPMQGPQLGSARKSEMNILDRDTGLYNGSYLSLRLADELHRSLRSGRALCVAIIGVDARGEPLDEETWRRLALILREQVREGMDVPARLESGELALLLPETSIEDGFFVVERFRQTVEKTMADCGLTVSAGVAARSLPAGGDPATRLMEAACDAYQRARQERNSVYCSALAAAPRPQPSTAWRDE